MLKLCSAILVGCVLALGPAAVNAKGGADTGGAGNGHGNGNGHGLGLGHGNGADNGHGHGQGLGLGLGKGADTANHGAPSFATSGPPGFSRGNKTGWQGETSPPGWSNPNGARTGWGEDATSPPGVPFR